MKSRKHKPEVTRGEPVVRAVLEATIEELAEVGYRALSVERIALRAKVARTTVYRRWPTKSSLVLAAIEDMPGAEASLPEGATVRDRLLEFGRRTARFIETTHGLAVMRLFVDDSDDELRETLLRVRAPRDAALRAVLDDAVRSGELSASANRKMIAELLPAAILTRALVHRAPIDRAYIEELVDFLLSLASAAPE